MKKDKSFHSTNKDEDVETRFGFIFGSNNDGTSTVEIYIPETYVSTNPISINCSKFRQVGLPTIDASLLDNTWYIEFNQNDQDQILLYQIYNGSRIYLNAPETDAIGSEVYVSSVPVNYFKLIVHPLNPRAVNERFTTYDFTLFDKTNKKFIILDCCVMGTCPNDCTPSGD